MLKLKEAIAYARQTKEVSKKDLARQMWKESGQKSASNSLCNLINGKRKSINIENVTFLCKELGVSADFLFGLDDCPTKMEKKMKINQYLQSASDLVADLKEEINTL